jgi:oxygen-dependent protoporphyrinogen oxidase
VRVRAGGGVLVMSPRVVVVGAGMAGLAAATTIRREAPGIDVLVLERRHRVGGLVASELTADGFVLEHGADCLVTTKPWGIEAVRAAGLADTVVTGGRAPRRTFVSTSTGLAAMPALFAGLQARTAVEVAFTPLLSLGGKVRLALEPLVRPSHEAADESVSAFVRRRFGAEAAAALLDPLLGGIYGGGTERLSVETCIPRLRAFEREHGSVTMGMRRAMRDRRQRRDAPLPPTITLRDGMASLPVALASGLASRVKLGVDVGAVSRTRRGFRIDTPCGTIESDGVVVATPAWRAPELVERLSPDLAAALGAVPYTRLDCVSFAWPRARVPHRLDGTGWVRGRGDRRPTLACTWSSEKWSGRAPAGFALVRSVLAVPDASEHELVEAAARDLRDLVGVEAPASLVRVRRLPRATPIYEVGHRERVASMTDAADAVGAVALAGNGLDGVGVPDCVAGGTTAARRILAALAA